MDVKEGYEKAKKNLVGMKIAIGPEGCREEWMAPISDLEYSKLPFDSSWESYRLRKRLGFLPSLFARMFAASAEFLGYDVTEEEWNWLHDNSCSREAALAWLNGISEASHT